MHLLKTGSAARTASCRHGECGPNEEVELAIEGPWGQPAACARARFLMVGGWEAAVDWVGGGDGLGDGGRVGGVGLGRQTTGEAEDSRARWGATTDGFVPGRQSKRRNREPQGHFGQI